MSILKHTFPPDISSLFDQELANQLAEAQGAISSLNQLILLLPNPRLLMRPILAKEAEASSQLEGTQASLEDAYKIDLADQSPEKRNDAIELRNYEQAMLLGLDLVEKNTLNNSTIKHIHKRLLQDVRGKKKDPGKYRDDDVWIGAEGTSKGEARYCPPDPTHVPALMDELERFYKGRGPLNPIIASGIIHHRFEAIHPFKDGNGRTGRLIIPLYLVDQKLLKLPVFYISGYFDKDKATYMDKLSGVDQNEDWYSWLLYYLKGIEVQAKQTLEVGIKIKELFDECRSKIGNERAHLGLVKVLEYAFTKLMVTAPMIVRDLELDKKTAHRYLTILVKHEVLDRAGIYKKQRLFINGKLLSVLRSI